MEDKKAKRITLNELARMMAGGFAELREEMNVRFAEVNTRFSALDTDLNARFSATDSKIDKLGNSLHARIDQLDAKVEKYHHEIKADATTLRGVVGGISRTQIDYEKRIKVLEAK